MTETKGEVVGISKRHDSVCLVILLEPENCVNPANVWDYLIGDKIKVVDMGGET